MTDQERLCRFCCKQDALKNSNGLDMCSRCSGRFGGICDNYRDRLSSQVSAAGWTVELTSHSAITAERFPEACKPLFYLECKKNSVTVTTAIDKIAFFAAATRLQSDLQKAARRPSPRTKKAARRVK